MAFCRRVFLALFLLAGAFHLIDAQVPQQPNFKIGFFTSGPIQDGGYISGIYDGLIRIQKKYGVQIGFNGAAQNMTFERLAALGADYPFPPDFVGYDVITCGGFIFEAPIRAWAAQQPNMKFIIIDQSITDSIPNLLAVIFREDQAGYMAGVAAGIISKTKTVAMFGGFEIPPVRKYITGFTNGILNTCPDCKVIIKYVLSFIDPDAGFALGRELVDQYNADVIFPVAGGSGFKVLTDLPSIYPNVRTIGVDTDAGQAIFLNDTAQPGMQGLALSVGKALDVAIESALSRFLDTKVFPAGQIIQTAGSGGVKVFPCYLRCDELNPATNPTMVSIFDKLKTEELTTSVSTVTGVPNVVTDTALLNTWQQFRPAFRPQTAIYSLLTTLTLDSTGTNIQLLTGGGNPVTWFWSPTQLAWEEGPIAPAVTKASLVSYGASAFLFGGDAGTNQLTNNLWLFNYTDAPFRWQQVNFTNGPAARQGHSAVIYGTKMVIFGGLDSVGQPLNDLWAYDIPSGVWTKLPNTAQNGVPPQERFYHTAVTIGDVMYVYAGSLKSLKLANDIQGYDFVASQWFTPPPTDRDLPELQFHSAVAIGSSMIVVGGVDSNQRKRPYTIRVDLERTAPQTRVTINATFPAVGENIDNPICPGSNATRYGGISLAGIAVNTVAGSDGGQIWIFGGSNTGGVRQDVMLYNNFNVTLDIQSAQKRTLKYVKWEDGSAIAVNVITGLLMAITVIVTIVWSIYIGSPIIALSNPIAGFAMLLGILSLYAGVFTYPGNLTAGQCGIRPWLIGGGAAFLLGPMLAKLYRLFRILENTSLVQTAISTKTLLIYSGVVVGVEFLFLIIWTAVDRLKPHVTDASSSTQSVLVCSCHHFWVYMGIQLAYIGILIISGIFFAFRTRSISSKVFWGDTTFISYTFYLSALAVVLLALISGFLYKFYIGGYLTLMILYVICISVALALLFGVKLFVIFFRKAQMQTSSTGHTSSFSSEFKPPEDFDAPL